MATLSCARPWYNTTTSVAAYGTGYGTGLIGTAPYVHQSSTKAAEAHAAGCSVTYITVTSTPVSATTDGPLSPTTSVEKYSYAIESGTTSWLNGVSPPATQFDSTVLESSTVVVGTITATTNSTTTETVQSSSELPITGTTTVTNTHTLTRTRTKTGISEGSETETADTTSWQWASTTGDTTGFPSLMPSGSQGLSFTGVLSASTSATVVLPVLSSTSMLSASTSATVVLPVLSSTSMLSEQTSATTSLPVPSLTGVSSVQSSATNIIPVPSTTEVSPVLHTSPAAPSPTACGEVGNYTINWDDEPLFVQPKNSTSTLFPPVFSPYHHLFYANGFSYLAPPAGGFPFPATSSPNTAVFMPDLVIDATAKNHSVIKTENLLPGEISAGRRAIDKIWTFDAYGADLGCENENSSPCAMTITGYAFDANTTSEYPIAQQKVELPACDSHILHSCTLKHVDLQGFRGLSGIQFEATVSGRQSIFVLDSLNLGWCDNSCAAGLKRFKFGKN
ncbi:hypothetical protein EG328_004652 [Venturia inaequalis]|uniref:DUF7371 domain-containing protein n=1 Tax=Venturia inaequalis TaxID=5025 RepID=A0A8H3UQL5_VENIN|nr:hypothetical protein EG328_004652 [Venturia inaequalis]